MWLLEWWRDLVGEDGPHLAVRERPVDHGAPEHDLSRGAETDGEGVRLARRAAHVLDGDRDARRHPAAPRARSPNALSAASRSGVVVSVRRYGCANAKTAADDDEDRRPGDPPRLSEVAGEEHDDEERDADRREHRGQLDPAVERPLEVSDLAQVVAARPPDAEQAEGQLHEPGDAEPEHAEQHAGADRAGGGLASRSAGRGAHRSRA